MNSASTQIEFPSVHAAASYWLTFGLQPIPADVVTQKPTVDTASWLAGLSHEQIDAHWEEHPEDQIGIFVGEDLLFCATNSVESYQALYAIERKSGTLPNLVIKESGTTLHCFKRADSSRVDFDTSSREKAADSIDIRTGKDWVILPPSCGSTLSLAMADNAGDLVEASQDFIDDIGQHNGWSVSRSENVACDAVPLPLEPCCDPVVSPKVPPDRLVAATGIAKGLISKVKDDSGAPLEDEAIQALAVLQQDSPANFHRIRAELKQANRNVSLVAIKEAIKAQAVENETARTHHGYASDLIAKLTVGEWSPVGHEGILYVVEPTDGLWVRNPTEALERLVAQTHDGKENCQRRADYGGIAQHVISLASNESFFADAPIGVACPDGFYQIAGNAIKVEALTPAHRQRVKLSISPAIQKTPLFDAFMHETFQSKNEGEEAQQRVLVQEIAGAILLGIMHQHQKAVKFYDAFGRAGKGTLERMLRQLVPPSFVAAVSPFVWHKEYYVAALAGIRLNVVGELPDDEPIPAAMFKTVTGGDLITGRHPSHRPISFKNEAAHLFMTNHLINTRDHSEAFFARWLIVEFPNSRLRTGLPIDPMLADRIIACELPGIAQWALDGAVRLMHTGSFSKSAAHDRLMAQWRRRTNSLEEFIHDGCELGSEFLWRRAEFYQAYASWARDCGRRPFGKTRVKDLLGHNVGFGISLVELNGYETFRGVRAKPMASFDPLANFDDRF